MGFYFIRNDGLKLRGCMKLTIVTPEKKVFDGEVKEVYLPGYIGEFGVLPEHANLVSRLCLGICRYSFNGSKEKVLIGKGMAKVSGNEIQVLTDLFEKSEDIDKASSEESLKNIQSKLEDKNVSEDEKGLFEEEQKKEIARLELLNS